MITIIDVSYHPGNTTDSVQLYAIIIIPSVHYHYAYFILLLMPDSGSD